MDIRTFAKPKVRLATTVGRSFKKLQISKINKTENFEAKISASEDDESDLA